MEIVSCGRHPFAATHDPNRHNSTTRLARPTVNVIEGVRTVDQSKYRGVTDAADLEFAQIVASDGARRIERHHRHQCFNGDAKRHELRHHLRHTEVWIGASRV